MASFCVIKPRKRLTGWTNVSGSIWSSPFSSARVTLVYSARNAPLDLATSSALSDGDWYFDGSTVYVLSISDPDAFSFPGFTIEFDLYFSDQDYTAPSDPLDTGSKVVDWNGSLISTPNVVNGSSETLYGFTPLVTGSIVIANQDGYMNEFLHDCSFNFSLCKAWINGTQVFLGYTKGVSLDTDGTLTLSCTDYNYFFDRNINLDVASPTFSYYNTIEHPNLQPEAHVGLAGENPWYKRRVFGMVDGHVCVNIDYNATASTTVNRDWAAMFYDGDTVGTIVQDLDHLAANTTTRTYFEQTPQVNAGDWVVLNNNGTLYYTEVNAVNRALKYIDHDALGARTFIAADTCTRYFIGRVIVEDSDGQSWWLRPGIDYTVFTDGTNKVAGFIMADNWEAALGFTETPFDPAQHKLFVRVYGAKDLDQYADSTDVGALASQGGVASQAVSLLYKTIIEAGFPASDIDKSSFEDVGADSHSLGYAIPPAAADVSGGTYKEKIDAILSSMLWTLSFVNVGGEMKLGLGAYRPFVSAGDYEADEEEHSNFSFEINYSDVYSNFEVNYFLKESNIELDETQNKRLFVTSPVGADLNFASNLYTRDTLHFDSAEAGEFGLRLAYTLGERRGIYKLFLGVDYLNSTNLGTSYNISREQMPGFSFVIGTEQTRQLSVIEVQKDSLGVNISLDDQKGIQDNAGDW